MRDLLMSLHREFIGEDTEEKADSSLIVELLEHLLRKMEEQEGHTHQIR